MMMLNRSLYKCKSIISRSLTTTLVNTTSTAPLLSNNRTFTSTSTNTNTNDNNITNSSSTRSTSSTTSKKQNEIDFFNSLAKDWWNEEGEMKPLHRMNPVRVQYIVDKLKEIGLVESNQSLKQEPLKGLNIIDVGCGAGLLTESLCRLGANVVGLDAAEQNIKMAISHANLDHSLSQKLKQDPPQLQYIESTIENHSSASSSNNQPTLYDVVCSLEVVEHVENAPEFISNLTKILKPGGSLFISTINRTPLSYLVTIVGAEYLFRLVSVGTHQHSQYITPSELKRYVEADPQMRLIDQKGFFMNPITQNWSMIDDTKVNYIIHATKLK